MPFLRAARQLVFLLALLGATVATAQDGEPAAAKPTRPALWRVADADTTIFLFGTVHALPEGSQWLQGTVAGALLSSDTLATEVAAANLTDPAFLQRYAETAKLPEGQTLRAMLTGDQRAKYEKALEQAKIDPASFDKYKPWFAANALVVAPLIAKGYNPAAGGEKAIASVLP